MLRYEIVDVFTARAFTGNPLAVVLNGHDLTTTQMQAIAGEFNLSETVFVLPPTDDATYRVRIFTPNTELPYAGHPSIGTAVTLARRGDIPQGNVLQECRDSVFPVTVEGEFATLSGATPSVGERVDPAGLLEMAGLEPSDLAGTPMRASAGLEFTYLPVKPDAVGRASRHSHSEFSEVYVFSYDSERRVVHARLFDRDLGIGEDPATGSGALGLGAYLAEVGAVSDGSTTYVVEQGAEIKRPSQLECTVDVKDGRARSVQARGQALLVARGELLTLP